MFKIVFTCQVMMMLSWPDLGCLCRKRNKSILLQQQCKVIVCLKHVLMFILFCAALRSANISQSPLSRFDTRFLLCHLKPVGIVPLNKPSCFTETTTEKTHSLPLSLLTVCATLLSRFLIFINALHSHHVHLTPHLNLF